ncbi:MAG: site-2 protease family protein [Oscillospiraceae bacterium]|nr:site-2 protease family protein [Oscillospiraceae bacterium]
MLNVLQNLDWMKLVDMLLSVIPVLICITVHECCHGLCALWLGDDTAKRAGRLSLNPIKHFDVIGFIMLVTVGFGWAKPVPIDMRRFKNPRQGMALTALAGPASNIVLAIVMLFIFGLLFVPLQANTVGYYVLVSIMRTATLSISLAVFNIIPISPLDGSKVLFSFLPDEWYYKLMRYERYGMLVLVLLTMTDVLSKPLGFLTQNVYDKLMVFAQWGMDITAHFIT